MLIARTLQPDREFACSLWHVSDVYSCTLKARASGSQGDVTWAYPHSFMLSLAWIDCHFNC